MRLAILRTKRKFDTLLMYLHVINTGSSDPWKVGNIVALEWRSDEEISQDEPVKMIGQSNSI